MPKFHLGALKSPRHARAFLGWSLVIALTALPTIARSNKPSKEEWKGAHAMFMIECNCGEPRSKKNEDKCPKDKTVKGHISAPINATAERLASLADHRCQTVLGQAKVCSRGYCKVDSTKEELDIQAMFGDGFDVSNDDDSIYIKEKGEEFKFDADLDGSAVVFDVQTREFLKKKIKQKDGTEKTVWKLGPGRAKSPLRAPTLYPLVFDYFASKGSPIKSVKGCLAKYNLYTYLNFRERILKRNAQATEIEVMTAFVRARKGTTRYWKDHLNRSYGKVIQADLSAINICFEVELGE